RSELVDSRIDRALQLENLPTGVDSDLATQVTVGDGSRHFGDVADLVGQVGCHPIDVAREFPPDPGGVWYLSVATQDSLGADFSSDARHFVCKTRKLIDHGVDGALQVTQLAIRVDSDLFREITRSNRGRH